MVSQHRTVRTAAGLHDDELTPIERRAHDQRKEQKRLDDSFEAMLQEGREYHDTLNQFQPARTTAHYTSTSHTH